MILIALGSNLPGRSGAPMQNCLAALAALEKSGVRVVRRSRFYRSPAWPDPSQPSFVNAVAALETKLAPEALLAQLHEVERALGRVRTPGAQNAPRIIDLDLLDYDGRVNDTSPPVLPHPRLQDRAFVLRPLADIAPDWRHPKSGRSIKDLLADLPKDAVAEPIEAP
jgi:2-amino-4-hydroxy-6-hydroxymethyldihydropteridine diphosphokinase